MANAAAGAIDRRACILTAQSLGTCRFSLAENPRATGREPIYELAAFSEVGRYGAIVDRVAAETGVEARLIRAVMYMETTHGYYDAPLSWIGRNRSLRPMNVNVVYWGSAFGGRRALEDPYRNVRAGAEILFRIRASLPPGARVSHVATLYNDLSARHVSDYGARVQRIYESQPWLGERAR